MKKDPVFKATLGLALLLFSVAFASPAFAAEDAIVKRFVRAVENEKLDKACEVRVEAVRVKREGRDEFDLELTDLGNRQSRRAGRVRFDTCGKVDGEIHCVNSASVAVDAKWKICQMERLVFTPEDGLSAASLRFESASLKAKQKKDCSEDYFEKRGNPEDLVKAWDCTALRDR